MSENLTIGEGTTTLDYLREAHPWLAEMLDELKEEAKRKSCPCLHTTPCHPHCTCANPVMSHGCDRCCSYGSPEQQKKAAERLAGLQTERDKAHAEAQALRLAFYQATEAYQKARAGDWDAVTAAWKILYEAQRDCQAGLHLYAELVRLREEVQKQKGPGG